MTNDLQVSFKELGDKWLRDIQGFFEKEWNYTLTQPSITSFDQAFFHPEMSMNFTEFVENQRKEMKEQRQKMTAWVKELIPDAKKVKEGLNKTTEGKESSKPEETGAE